MRGVLRYVLVLVNRLLATPQLQDRLEKQLILEPERLLSSLSRLYL